MGFELELLTLLAIQTLGTSIFAVFEVETPAWRKILKWSTVIVVTAGIYELAGHWALLWPLAAAGLGGTVHTIYCRREGIHPLKATPRRRYYALRGWDWVD